MPVVTIEERGCRGCTLCVDTCPAKVFRQDPTVLQAEVVRPEDCVGCFACYYLCPSQCIEISGVPLQRPFYRIEENVALVEKFLQIPTATESLSVSDWDEAFRDTAMMLESLAQAIYSILGAGARGVGRSAGTAAANHLPEIFEEVDTEGVLRALQSRFKHCFDFDYRFEGDDIGLQFRPCALSQIVMDSGQEPGKAILCQLFHDYLSGLLAAFTGTNYRCLINSAGHQCVLTMQQKIY